jgi:hypothetical protein
MKIFIVIGMVLFLTGCTSPMTVASLCSNVVTYGVTGKTNSDIAVSVLIGQDCKLVRILQEDEKVCKVR